MTNFLFYSMQKYENYCTATTIALLKYHCTQMWADGYANMNTHTLVSWRGVFRSTLLPS